MENVSDQAVARPAADREVADAVEAAGNFRIYLGAAAGVGKTYAMLNEGHRRLSRGTDVVIGFVECHGRKLTTRPGLGGPQGRPDRADRFLA